MELTARSYYFDFTGPRHLVEKIDTELDNVIFELNMKGHKITRKQVNKFIKTGLIMATMAATNGAMGVDVFAASPGDGIESKIIKAFDPIVRIMRGLGYPAAVMMETAGALVMFFDKRRGLQIMKNGIIAFIVLNFVPAIVKILIEVGGAIGNDF